MTPPPPAPAPHRKPNVMCADETDESQLRTNPNILLYPQVNNGKANHYNANNNSNCPSNAHLTVNNTNNRNHVTAMESNLLTEGVLHVKRPTPLSSSSSATLIERISSPRTSCSPLSKSPVWMSRHLDVTSKKNFPDMILNCNKTNNTNSVMANASADEDDVDTDLETDRLLGHQRLDDQGYCEENKSWERKPTRSLLSKISPKQTSLNSVSKTRNGYNALLSATPEIPPTNLNLNLNMSLTGTKIATGAIMKANASASSPEHSERVQLTTAAESAANSAIDDIPEALKHGVNGLPEIALGHLSMVENNERVAMKSQLETMGGNNGSGTNGQVSVSDENGANQPINSATITGNGNGSESGSGSGSGNSNGNGSEKANTSSSNSNLGSIVTNNEKKVKKSKNKEGKLFDLSSSIEKRTYY